MTYAAPTQLRFDGAVLLADHNRLAQLVGEANVRCGVLIAPYMASNAVAFDHGSDVEGLLDRPADAFLYTTGALGVFGGKSGEIGSEALLEKYCGRAYLTVMLDGKTHTVYADYDLEAHVRNAHGVTACAFEDRSDTATVSGEKIINVYLIAGQSNAVGYGMDTGNKIANSDERFTEGFENVLYYASLERVVSTPIPSFTGWKP